MKLIILGDVHVGCRNDSAIFAESHIKFFTDQLFPFMQLHDIHRIVQLGDIFDRRKFVNFQILNLWKSQVFNYMRDHGITMDIITGNHDVYYKNTNEVNSPVLLLNEYENITSYVHCTEVKIEDTQVLFVPWINQTNETETMKLVKKTKAMVAMGHFEFSGFEMDKGHKIDHGMSTDKFKKFDMVLSGHYHHKSDNGHIFYTGTPYQITWSDYGSTKGFHVWDSATLELEFIPNPSDMFIKYHFDDSSAPETYWQGFDCNGVEGKYIKVVVVNKKNIYGFDQLLSKIYSKGPAEVKIIENMQDFDAAEIEEDLHLENTDDILNSYIDAVDTHLDKDKLKSLMRQLYVEAQHLEAV